MTTMTDYLRRLRVLLAWREGELSEGQAARLLGVDRLTLREWLLEELAAVKRLSLSGGAS